MEKLLSIGASGAAGSSDRGEQGDEQLGGGERTVAADEAVGAGVGRVDEGGVPLATRATSPRRPAATGDDGPEPALVDDLVPGAHPRAVVVLGVERRRAARAAAGPGVEPPEPGLAGLDRDVLGHARRRLDELIAGVDLAVVGGDDDRGAGRQHGEDVADEAVGGRSSAS